MRLRIGRRVDLAPVCRRDTALDRDAAPLPRGPTEAQVERMRQPDAVGCIGGHAVGLADVELHLGHARFC